MFTLLTKIKVLFQRFVRSTTELRKYAAKDRAEINAIVAVSNPAFMLTVFWIYVVLYHLIFSALLVDFFVCAV